MLHHGHQRQQSEGAVQGGHQGHAEDLLGLGEHGQIDAAERHGRDQIGDEHQLFHQLAVEPAAALGGDVAKQLAEDGAEHAVHESQAQGVEQGVDELVILEDARQPLHNLGIGFANPVVEGKVVQGVDTFLEHEALHDQDDDWHDDAHCEEHEQRRSDNRPAYLPKADQGGSAALAADGGVGLAGADQLLVDEHGDGGNNNHQDRHGKSGLRIPGVDIHVQLAGQGVVLHRRTQIVDGSEGADGLGESQDHGRQDGRQHQRQSDLPQDHGLARALDLTHLLQLGVDGVQC